MPIVIWKFKRTGHKKNEVNCEVRRDFGIEKLGTTKSESSIILFLIYRCLIELKYRCSVK